MNSPIGRSDCAAKFGWATQMISQVIYNCLRMCVPVSNQNSPITSLLLLTYPLNYTYICIQYLLIWSANEQQEIYCLDLSSSTTMLYQASQLEALTTTPSNPHHPNMMTECGVSQDVLKHIIWDVSPDSHGHLMQQCKGERVGVYTYTRWGKQAKCLREQLSSSQVYSSENRFVFLSRTNSLGRIFLKRGYQSN